MDKADNLYKYQLLLLLILSQGSNSIQEQLEFDNIDENQQTHSLALWTIHLYWLYYTNLERTETVDEFVTQLSG